MQRYYYEGPVMEFGNCVNHRWKGETVAPSEKKARSNLIYQYKKQSNRIQQTKITLPGTLKIIS